jgi:uncharacterized membrane protein YhiD involved in acid resistance
MLPVLLGIGAALIAGAIVAGIIFIACLTFKKVKDWFNKKKSLTESDKNYVATAVKLALENGNIGHVSCVFDKKTKEIVDGQRIETEEFDEELSKKHKNKDVIFV